MEHVKYLVMVHELFTNEATLRDHVAFAVNHGIPKVKDQVAARLGIKNHEVLFACHFISFLSTDKDYITACAAPGQAVFSGFDVFTVSPQSIVSFSLGR
jgi:hypothetical protein